MTIQVVRAWEWQNGKKERLRLENKQLGNAVISQLGSCDCTQEQDIWNGMDRKE